MENPINIVVVEDQYAWRRTYINDLIHFNIHTIAEAENGLELIKLLRNKIIPDVILLDLLMPVMNGNKAFEIIRKEFPGTKVIIISNHADDGVIYNFMQRGIYGFFLKSCYTAVPTKLAEAIRYVHETGKYFEFKPLSKNHIRYSDRETDLMVAILSGKSSKEIAADLGVGEQVISKHKANLHRKTNTKNAGAFIVYAVENGLKFLSRIKRFSKKTLDKI